LALGEYWRNAVTNLKSSEFRMIEAEKSSGRRSNDLATFPTGPAMGMVLGFALEASWLK